MEWAEYNHFFLNQSSQFLDFKLKRKMNSRVLSETNFILKAAFIALIKTYISLILSIF